MIREPRGRHRFSVQIKFEDARNGDNGRRLVAVFKSYVSERLGAINEESAADPALVLDHPISPAVLANHE
jgi:hypothetical protein